MTSKIGLPENRKRLKGAGIEHARSASFDAGVKYTKNQIAFEAAKEKDDSKTEQG